MHLAIIVIPDAKYETEIQKKKGRGLETLKKSVTVDEFVVDRASVFVI
jgi:hypothetical protein